MVVMLVDHVGQHRFSVLLEGLATDAGAAPRHLLPHHQAKLVAEVEDEAILLVVAEADEVCAHLLDELHLLAHNIVAHRSGESRVISVAVSAPKKHALSVELERAMLHELGGTDAEALLESGLTGGGGERDAAAVEVGRLWRPEVGSGQSESW